MKDDGIVIEVYDPQWVAMFEQEKVLLTELLQPWLVGSIEHVGSTAIAGMAAKSVIDIMVGVKSLVYAKPAIEIMNQNGYCYYPYKAEVMHWFCKPTPEFRTHHLHLIPFESPLWRARLAFRDHLRCNNHDAQAYASLKNQLAERYPYDREAYTQHKGPFIAQLLAKLGHL